ncbi:MAG: PIN domain-containing protein [Nanoarchaeota archaeon]|nr:PIN domain-containing protein [Nanoarchaeota archaeon]
MKYIIDAFSWIEYLEGSEKGKKVYEILSSDAENYSLSITIAEVVSKVKRKNGNQQLAYNSIISNSKTLEITSKIAQEAGLLHAEIRKKSPNFGIVDALLITAARDIKAKVLTGDHHFKQFNEAVLL